jgi:hypothetical protein
MKYWEMVLNPLAIGIIVYVFWIGPGVYRTWKEFKADSHNTVTLWNSVTVVWKSFAHRTPSWLSWTGILMFFVGIGLLLWEEIYK